MVRVQRCVILKVPDLGFMVEVLLPSAWVRDFRMHRARFEFVVSGQGT